FSLRVLGHLTRANARSVLCGFERVRNGSWQREPAAPERCASTVCPHRVTSNPQLLLRDCGSCGTHARCARGGESAAPPQPSVQYLSDALGARRGYPAQER